MHREMGQPSLADSLLPQTLGRNERLERIDEVVDWERLGQLVSEGRPIYPPIMMIKALLLQQWYNLSDPQMEESLADRISFRRETRNNRQVIVVTHNPNIVVHGDAEFVLSLKASKSQTVIACQGGLQERRVRDEICEVMEGGREAFQDRYRRLSMRGNQSS